MRISTIATTLLGLAATLTTTTLATPPAVRGLEDAIRKEVREMSEDEWTTYAGAIKLVQESGFWQDMAGLHQVNFRRGIHNNPVFFPWHRAYLRLMEEELSIVAGTTVTIPYWDWTLDSADMNASPIFGPDLFGGFSSDRSQCVTDGPFQILSSPDGDRCLRRGRSYRGNGYDRAAVLRRFQDRRGNPLIGDEDFDTVRRGIESVHNSVHSSISGDMGGAASPVDPIFYSHHMMIDNLWSVWQARDARNVYAYQGAVDDLLVDLGNWTTADTFDVRPFDALEEQVSRVAALASRLAERAEEDMESVEFSISSESVAILNALESMDAMQLDQVPRTCAAPLRNTDSEMFWDAENEEPLIVEMEERFQLAQDLGLEETSDCLASPEVIQRLIDGDLEGNSDGAGLGLAEGVGLAAGVLGLVAVVAAVALSRRRKNQQVFDAAVPDQYKLAAGEAFPEL